MTDMKIKVNTTFQLDVSDDSPEVRKSLEDKAIASFQAIARDEQFSVHLEWKTLVMTNSDQTPKPVVGYLLLASVELPISTNIQNHKKTKTSDEWKHVRGKVLESSGVPKTKGKRRKNKR